MGYPIIQTGGGGGASAFLDLTDTPGTFTALQLVRNNAAGDGLEYVDGSTLYAASSHTHVEADITDLGNYSVTTHTHTVSDLSDTTITGVAKGDMLVYNGSAWIDLTVGTNDDVLTADSAVSAGVKWAAAAGGGGGNNWLTANNSTDFGTAPSATGTSAVALGDNAKSNYSHSVSIGTNTQAYYGSYTVAIGYACQAGSDGIAIGRSTFGRGQWAVALGNAATANVDDGIAIGRNTNSLGTLGTAIGRDARAAVAACAFGAFAKSDFSGETFTLGSGYGGSQGDQKYSLVLLRTQTTTASITTLGVTGTAYNAVTPTDKLKLMDNSTYLFDVDVVARRTDVNDEGAAYNFKFAVDRNTGAGTCALIGSVTKTIIGEDTAAWNVDVVINTTDGSVDIDVTGEASKTIKWCAMAKFVKVAN